MRLVYFVMAALLSLSPERLFADHQAVVSAIPAKGSDEKAAEPLPDPTEAAGKLKQQLPPKPEQSEADSLEDPTRLNESFRSTLQHSGRAKAVPESGAAAPALPDISLVASVCGRHRDNAAAMLRINNKTEIVHAGDKLTRIEKNQLIEIHIL
ncbi:MAG: hypothetical protein ACU83O_12040, partial [Gammaproteobacteria bacterium]